MNYIKPNFIPYSHKSSFIIVRYNKRTESCQLILINKQKKYIKTEYYNNNEIWLKLLFFNNKQQGIEIEYE